VLSDRRISERLVAELRAAFLDEEDGDPHLTTDRLATLPYLSAVTEESMRLGAPLGTFARVVPANGAMVAGRYVVGGTIVSVPAWAQNISEQNFSPNSEQFLPERWLPGGLGPNSHANRNAIMTFSHGASFIL
jgi:cytochrome P450